MSPKPYNFIFKCITTFKAYRYSTEKINRKNIAKQEGG